MNYQQAVEAVFGSLKEDDICLFTTGFVSRNAFSIKDREANFYVIGSMGLVSSLGLGIALNTKKRVIIFDGDGSALMDLGTMAMIAASKPSNLIHIVLDNRSYQSTGGQPTISRTVDLGKIADSCGYRYVSRLGKIPENKRGLNALLDRKGPLSILLDIDVKAVTPSGRVSIAPEELSRRLKHLLGKVRKRRN